LGDTNSDYPREVVEVVLALAPFVVPALASVINTWIKNPRVIKSVKIKGKDGTEIKLAGVSAKQLKSIIEATQR
jgi:hypothetical protein